jgi:hypothetical protein
MEFTGSQDVDHPKWFTWLVGNKKVSTPRCTPFHSWEESLGRPRDCTGEPCA